MALTEVDVARLNDDVFAATGSNKNRIINGDMRIDQRNAGASVTPSSGSTYLVDRWYVYNSQASKFSSQQNAGSVTPPSGFVNYLGITSLSAYSVGASDEFLLTQRIEGLNTSDLAWGTASAQAVTCSFWARSSLTGSFGGAVKNSAANRSYLFSFTVNTADTWEYKTITIPGDTGGTWLTTNGIGISLGISLGAGSTYLGTAGSWSGSNFDAPIGSVNLVGTSGATFYITGVQLEAGDTATPFERRNYGQELALCQRYYEEGYADSAGAYISAAGVSIYGTISFSVTKCKIPTVTAPSNWSTQASGGTTTSRTFGTGAVTTNGFAASLAGSDPRGQGTWRAAAEL